MTPNRNCWKNILFSTIIFDVLVYSTTHIYFPFLKLSRGDTAELKSITTDHLFIVWFFSMHIWSKFWQSLKSRLSKPPVKCDITPLKLETKIVDAVYCQVQILGAVDFVQVLVRFQTEFSDPEYIVFEKCLSASKPSWKIVGKMNETTDFNNLFH